MGMKRRSVLWLGLLLASGCSKAKRRKSAGPANRPKGPQGFGNMMAKEWAKDLADKSPEKRARAARELANMGPAAKSALPALERAAKDKNKDVATAAKQAITAIRK
jgi:hypothetical protein